MAHELGKPVVQLVAASMTRDKRVASAGKAMRWTWPNLQKLLAYEAPCANGDGLIEVAHVLSLQ